jgi:hypothetical protein
MISEVEQRWGIFNWYFWSFCIMPFFVIIIFSSEILLVIVMIVRLVGVPIVAGKFNAFLGKSSWIGLVVVIPFGWIYLWFHLKANKNNKLKIVTQLS